jgi:hypothetical protein
MDTYWLIGKIGISTKPIEIEAPGDATFVDEDLPEYMDHLVKN